MKRIVLHKTVTALLLVLALAGCESKPLVRSDNSVKLVPTANGKGLIAVPPQCASDTDALGPWQNGMDPRAGCALARNLALQVETPQDLVEPAELGHPDAVVSSASIIDYRAGKTKQLIDAHSEAPSSTSATGSGETPK